jgi:hypothetical protein
MKFRTLAILAISSLFAASIATASNGVTLADDVSAMSGTNTMGGTNAMSGNIGNPNSDAQQMQSSTNQTSPSDLSNNNDDMSADTATGDDDY